MGFDFNNISGESFGDIKDVFFKKDGKSIIGDVSTIQEKVNVNDLTKEINTLANAAVMNGKTGTGQTIIQISKDVLGTEEDQSIILTQLEEKRKNTSSLRNKHFINIDDGEEVIIVEQNELYTGTSLLTVKHSNEKHITYPRGMFVGKNKQFVPKDFYIREAERALEDTIDKMGIDIMDIIRDSDNLVETKDGKYIEIVLNEPVDIVGGMKVPDRIQIPVKRMFDLEYKIMMLEYVICLDNKVASLLFVDIWF